MTVVENTLLGHELARGGVVLEKARMHAVVAELMLKFNLSIPLDVPVRGLGPAQRQLIQIAKADQLSRALFLDRGRLRSVAVGLVESLRIKTPSLR